MDSYCVQNKYIRLRIVAKLVALRLFQTPSPDPSTLNATTSVLALSHTGHPYAAPSECLYRDSLERFFSLLS